MGAGRLDAYRASVVAAELEAAPPEVAATVVAALEGHFELEDAAHLRRRCRRVLARISPDLLRQRAARARAECGLRRWVEEPGVDRWEGTFPSEDAAQAWAAIDALARQYVADGECATHRSRARQGADRPGRRPRHHRHRADHHRPRDRARRARVGRGRSGRGHRSEPTRCGRGHGRPGRGHRAGGEPARARAPQVARRHGAGHAGAGGALPPGHRCPARHRHRQRRRPRGMRRAGGGRRPGLAGGRGGARVHHRRLPALGPARRAGPGPRPALPLSRLHRRRRVLRPRPRAPLAGRAHHRRQPDLPVPTPPPHQATTRLDRDPSTGRSRDLHRPHRPSPHHPPRRRPDQHRPTRCRHTPDRPAQPQPRPHRHPRRPTHRARVHPRTPRHTTTRPTPSNEHHLDRPPRNADTAPTWSRRPPPPPSPFNHTATGHTDPTSAADPTIETAGATHPRSDRPARPQGWPHRALRLSPS